MNRTVPVILGALSGAVVLPAAMFACIMGLRFVLPSFAPISINSFGVGVCVFLCPLLGAASVILWGGKRTFWPRLGSAICALVADSPFVWALKQDYYNYYVLKNGPLAGSWFLTEVVFASPPLLLAFALLFFAVLIRPRAVTP